MKRREFISLVLSAAVTWPLGTRAQTPRKIGFLHPESLSPDVGTLSIARQVWLRLGYIEGETVLLRSAEGELSRLPQLVAELIRHEIGVLMVVGPAAVRAAHRTSTVPIVEVPTGAPYKNPTGRRSLIPCEWTTFAPAYQVSEVEIQRFHRGFRSSSARGFSYSFSIPRQDSSWPTLD